MKRVALLAGALAGAAALLLAGCRTAAVRTSPAAEWRWWKGNTHTHSLWTDGDDYPEMIAEWYRANGYHFLVMTDHNSTQSGEQWVRVPPDGKGQDAYRKYRERLGAAWVEERRRGDTLEVRLRAFDEYRPRYDEGGRFLLLRGEEITQYVANKAAHMNAFSLATPIPPLEGGSVREILQRDLDSVAARARTAGGPIVAHVNHPNWLWSMTPADLAALSGARFFEVWNGHPAVNNAGDSAHVSTDRMWDLALAERLATGGDVLFGVATDDAHDYHAFAADQRNPGRGWVAVRAPALTPEAIAAAMARGDFYASTGVELADVRRDGRRISIAIRPEAGVTYATQFIGTRDPARRGSGAVADGGDIGVVLAEVAGTAPGYTLAGDELYVRARVVSSASMANPPTSGEPQRAWTQPVVRPAGGW